MLTGSEDDALDLMTDVYRLLREGLAEVDEGDWASPRIRITPRGRDELTTADLSETSETRETCIPKMQVR